ncbi:MAG: hypothetical protein WAR81_02455, partial [Pseudomonadales bacterium]
AFNEKVIFHAAILDGVSAFVHMTTLWKTRSRENVCLSAAAVSYCSVIRLLPTRCAKPVDSHARIAFRRILSVIRPLHYRLSPSVAMTYHEPGGSASNFGAILAV